MARKNPARVTIPPGPPPAAPEGEPMDDGNGEPLGNVEMFDTTLDNPALDLFRETGDAGALADASFADWSWQVYRLRTAEEVSRDRKGNRREWMMRLEGPLDLGLIKRECGGGTFEIWGYFGGRLRTRLRQDIGGPRRSWDTPEPAPRSAIAHQAQPFTPREDSATLRLLEQQGRLLERIAERVVQPAAPVQQLGVADVIALADRLNQREAPSPSGDVLKELVSAFRMGMDVKADAAGTPERSTAEMVLDKLAPLAEKIAMAVVTPRRPGPPRPGAAPVPPASGSRAEVVDPPEATGPAAVEPGAHRWPAVIEALANGIAAGGDPADFCTTLELLLPPQDLGMLRLASVETVLEQIRQHAAGAYPILATEQAAAFVQAVLAELNATDGVPG